MVPFKSILLPGVLAVAGLVSLVLISTGTGMSDGPGGAAQAATGYRYSVILRTLHIGDKCEGIGRGKSGEFRFLVSEKLEGEGQNVRWFSRKLREQQHDLNLDLGEVWTAGPTVTLWVRFAEVDTAPINVWADFPNAVDKDCYCETALALDLRQISRSRIGSESRRITLSSRNWAELEIKAYEAAR